METRGVENSSSAESLSPRARGALPLGSPACETLRIGKFSPPLLLSKEYIAACIRSRISLAALLVKVTAKIRSGATPLFIKFTILCVIVLVFPAPAPAIIRSGPFICSAASLCFLFRSLRCCVSVTTLEI